MPSFKITLAYDGTDFVGWQRQAAGTSVQGLLEDALRALDDRDVAVAGAGRTDAGVHALGQVASFTIARDMTAAGVMGALNARLPEAVRVIAAEGTPPAFHARFAALTKTYRYRIWSAPVSSPFEGRFAWHVPHALDVDAMRAAATVLVGAHDFAAFQAAGSATRTTLRRILSLRIEDCGSRIDDSTSSFPNPQSSILNPQSRALALEVEGDGFLRHMVRAIAGSLVEVGAGRRSLDWLRDALASRDRARAGPTAPARGLFLVSVTYGVVESRFTSKEP